MDTRLRHLIERFPERTDIIKALNETNAKFKDLLGDHHDVSEELAKMKRADKGSEAGKHAELEQRKVALEEELILLMQAHQRI
jgi:uncharacterized protein YdcH (DUF465 family)